jgi:hypothetical protein
MTIDVWFMSAAMRQVHCWACDALQNGRIGFFTRRD